MSLTLIFQLIFKTAETIEAAKAIAYERLMRECHEI